MLVSVTISFVILLVQHCRLFRSHKVPTKRLSFSQFESSSELDIRKETYQFSCESFNISPAVWFPKPRALPATSPERGLDGPRQPSHDDPCCSEGTQPPGRALSLRLEYFSLSSPLSASFSSLSSFSDPLFPFPSSP